MAEKEPTVTVAVRLPLSQVLELRKQLEYAHYTMSQGLRQIVDEWLQAGKTVGEWEL